MKLRTSASLMVAVVLGLVTAYVGLDELKKAKGGQATSAKVVVAARDMEPGYVIEPADLRVEDVPASLAPARAFKETKLVAGRTVLASVVGRYPLIDKQLAAPAWAGAEPRGAKNMHAVAIEVSEAAPSRVISQGDYST